MPIKDTAFVDILCQGCSAYRELPTAVVQRRAAGTLCSYNRICSINEQQKSGVTCGSPVWKVKLIMG